ncbi:MAG: hypothetical protein ACRD1L_11785 [Terriglobales bacterium]
MAYDPARVLQLALECLDQNPHLTASGIAKLLGVDRGTLARTLRERGGFRRLRRELILKRISMVRSTRPPVTLKSLAGELGFPSAAALSQWLRRTNSGRTPHQQDLRRIV